MSKAEFIRLPTAPPDPVLQGARGERALNFNSATGRLLYKQNHMPMGIHAGKIMERVPGRYLMALRQAFGFRKPFDEEPRLNIDFKEAKARHTWFPVFSYCERHWEWIVNMAETEAEKEAQEGPAPQKTRDYPLRFNCTLIGLDAAKRTTSPKFKCELCHDNEQEPCECTPATRTARNEARSKQ